MYELAEYETLRPLQQNRREVAKERHIKLAPEDREMRTYVVRDLSWDLASYLDTQDLEASA